MASHIEQIKTAITKLEFLNGAIANAPEGTLRMEGLYFTFAGVIEEIKSALDGVEDRPAYAAINKIAS
ncbi:hypothetical protein [Sulfuricurvum sp.]|uniref:hypothetical protein n=1 Tax=Sulfuricurvum sp. TaxID=2025608 RepID=UPI0026331151|nr:hypothetical protein [Sulfuricurvum sp.]MDD2267438.1 hypothetical protein [Sulfuricurvum sp.]MDD2782840.1 hypothetical protein [Sulfuricurvum sp.]